MHHLPTKRPREVGVKQNHKQKLWRSGIYMYWKLPYSRWGGADWLPWDVSELMECLSARIHKGGEGGVPRRYHDLHTSVARGQPRLRATWLWYSTKLEKMYVVIHWEVNNDVMRRGVGCTGERTAGNWRRLQSTTSLTTHRGRVTQGGAKAA